MELTEMLSPHLNISTSQHIFESERGEPAQSLW